MNDDTYGVQTAPDTVRIERLLPGPIERLWAYLTESDKRAQWLAAGPMDLSAGAGVQLLFRNNELTPDDEPAPPKYRSVSGEHRMQGYITVCEPPHLLGLTWGEEQGVPSEVRFELSPQGSQVKLTVTHSRLSSRDDMLSVSGGWHTHLAILRARLEGTAPPGFWRTHTRLEAAYEERLPRAA
ncbi:MAG: SRPBCC family protein [Burkholderiaceae bacterium]|jgi:uncharacterized protein YndB with AHSA1/START domain|nr:SRPBCC family protein [Burkholderiaceae bacterium]MDO9090654.1 SRPBCC family protein [Burkholderiaceae bacterium]MDP1969214.1 SRPBCC family protein [Burkholderiaceae bacterium]MDP3134763.1 SRPBCC family protein [Burkholderiaceae bacterium]